MTRSEFEWKLENFLTKTLGFQNYYFETETFYENKNGNMTPEGKGKAVNINFNIGVLTKNFNEEKDDSI